MKRERMRRMILAAVVFTAVTALAAGAGAGIRITADIAAPGVRVYASNIPSCDVRHHAHIATRLPVRRRIHYEITLRDRRMARRLAWYTGVPAPRILRLRGFGYTWREIGAAMYVPVPVIRAARNQRSWNRFLAAGHRRYGRRGHGYKVTRYEEREYRRR